MLCDTLEGWAGAGEGGSGGVDVCTHMVDSAVLCCTAEINTTL